MIGELPLRRVAEMLSCRIPEISQNRDRDRDRDLDRKINDLEKEEVEDSRKDRKVTSRGGELVKGGRVF